MKEKTGVVFSIARDNEPVRGCTISKEICSGDNPITVFSMAARTDISAEMFPYHKMLIPASGQLTVYEPGGSDTLRTDGSQNPGQTSVREAREVTLGPGQAMLAKTDIPVGMKTETGTVYTEIAIRRTDSMNEAIKAGEVFKLAELVPYQEGKIVNMDVAHNEKMKFALMAFDAGTGLSDHAAPGEALIFALDGEAVIRYEGIDHPIKAGENFHFAKGGMHAVKAEGRFKMALVLTL